MDRASPSHRPPKGSPLLVPSVRRALMAAAVLLPLLVLPSVASADGTSGTYRVFACQTPSGSPVGVAGWAPARIGNASVANACGAGGPFSLTLPANSNTRSLWNFRAPAGTRIAGLNLRRTTRGLAGTSNNGVGYSVVATGSAPDGNRKTLEVCTKTDDACQTELSQPVSKPGLDAAGVEIRLGCSISPDRCPSTAATTVAIQQAVVTLRDAVAPRVVGPRVTDDGDRSGVLKVGFDATDVGGGLSRVETLVDGKPFRSQAVAGGTCADLTPGDADPYQYGVPVPCPLAANGLGVQLGYTALTPGPHTVLVQTRDAAGNTAAVYATQFPRPNYDTGGGSGNGGSGQGGSGTAPTTEQIRNGKLTAAFVTGKNGKRRTTSKTIRKGTRAVIRGQLKDSRGKGIQGARVDVYHLVRGSKRRQVKTGLKTRKGGRLTYIVSKKVDTRRIQLVFRAFRPGPATSTQRLRLRVKTRAGRTYYLPANRKKAGTPAGTPAR